MREIRFGIAGLGAIAQRHAQIVAESEGLELAALCDPVAERLGALGEKHGVAPERRFASLRDLLAARCCDVLTICAPSGLHGEMIEAAAAAGVSVLCEKPLEVNLAKVDAAIRACRRANVRLGVIYQRRGMRLFQRMAETVAAGGLGPLAMASASVKWFRPSTYYAAESWHSNAALEGGGCLANQGVHALDTVQWVAGGAEAVSAFTATRAHPIKIEDTTAAVIRYRNGAIGALEAATSVFPGEPMTFAFHGARGTILISNEKITRWVEAGEDRTAAMQAEQASWPETADKFGGHRALILDMAAAVREGHEPLVNGAAGRESVALLEAIYESARAGREVRVPPPLAG